MKHKELFRILEEIGEDLEITKSQYKLAEERYQAVGNWLAKGEYCISGKSDIFFKDGEIYPQGSIRLETTVKPIGRNEFDIDLVFYTPNISASSITPERLRKIVGERLRENEKYKQMLIPLNRGWRINYANEFHLDITPSLDNYNDQNENSELVSDRQLQQYMPTNPKGYATWFDEASLIQPSIQSTISLFESRKMIIVEDAATVTELPKYNTNKPLLKRFIQIFKRHRDIMFQDKDDAPISIIITTLATLSYLDCIKNYSYDNEYTLMIDTLRNMNTFIHQVDSGYLIENPTVKGENFAEKWNINSIKKHNFDKWNSEMIIFSESLANLNGQHKIFESLKQRLGEIPVNKIYEQITKKVSTNRKNGLLYLGESTNLQTSFPVKPNTFFGK